MSSKLIRRGLSTRVHETAALGYKTKDVASKYDLIRPTYNSEGISFLKSLIMNKAEVPIVLELGAGTGIQTKILSGMGAHVIATEPVEGMILKLEDVAMQLNQDKSSGCGRVKIMKATAEDIPVDDSSVDCVFVGQAFHWFNPTKACKEMNRVLKKDGIAILAWNSGNPEGSFEWYSDYMKIINAHKPEGTPQYRDFTWKADFEDPKSSVRKLFSELNLKCIKNYELYNREKLVSRAMSTSFINMLSDEDKAKAIREPILKVCEKYNLPDTFEYPYESHIYFMSPLK